MDIAKIYGNDELTPEEISEGYIAPLIEQLMKRFELVQKPCRAAMASKSSAKLK